MLRAGEPIRDKPWSQSAPKGCRWGCFRCLAEPRLAGPRPALPGLAGLRFRRQRPLRQRGTEPDGRQRCPLMFDTLTAVA
jgi:hypothetical protein